MTKEQDTYREKWWQCAWRGIKDKNLWKTEVKKKYSLLVIFVSAHVYYYCAGYTPDRKFPGYVLLLALYRIWPTSIHGTISAEDGIQWRVPSYPIYSKPGEVCVRIFGKHGRILPPENLRFPKNGWRLTGFSFSCNECNCSSSASTILWTYNSFWRNNVVVKKGAQNKTLMGVDSR